MKKKRRGKAKKDGLTPRQQRFIHEYLISLNATEAAIAAGYSEKTAKEIGCQNLTKLHIRARIDAELKRIEDSKIADATEVMQLLTKAARGTMEEQVVSFTPDGGVELVTKNIGARDRVKSLELLGKRYALFTDNLITKEEPPCIVDDIHE